MAILWDLQPEEGVELQRRLRRRVRRHGTWHFLAGSPHWRTLSIGDVQDAPAVQDDGVWEWIPVRKRDGACVFFDVGMFADPNGLSEARQLRSFLVAWIAHSEGQQDSR